MAPARRNLMFNNLIESSSHRSELKRRGSFFLFTTVTYALLFILAGVASIYAYDARLGEQDLEVSILSFAPPNIPEAPPRPSETTHSTSTASSHVSQPVRPILYDRPDNPANPPTEVGTIAPAIPPAPPNTVIGSIIADPPSAGSPNGSGSASNSGSGPVDNNIEKPPPPAPKPTPVPRIIKSPSVLNGQALVLPKPAYPQMAKMMKIEGKVTVQILIDESGKVISARAVDGHPLLRQVSETAAIQARFSPTKLGEQAVKVSGVITYNFVLQ